MRITITESGTHHVAFDPGNLPTYSQMEEALANAVMNVISQHRNRHVGRASIQTFLAPPDLAHFHACRHYAVIIRYSIRIYGCDQGMWNGASCKGTPGRRDG